MSTQFTNRQWRLPNNENKDKQSNYSMDFDGSGLIDISSVVSSISSSATGTVSGWLNWKGSNSYTVTFTSNSDTSQQYLTFQGISNGNAYAQLKNKWILQTNSAVFTSGNWHHFVVTQNGTEPKIYINGTEYSNGNGATLTTYGGTNGAEWWPDLASFNTATIGGMIWNSGGTVYTNYGVSEIDGLAIFDYALSSSQITTLYGSSSTGIGNPMSLSPKPVSYYPLGDQDAFNGADYLVPNSSLKDYVFDFGTFTSNDRIVINDTFDTIITGTNFTISSWINLDSIDPQQLKFIFTNETLQFTITNKITTYLRGASGYFLSPFNSNTTLSTGKWYNIVLVKSGSDYTYYLNGSADGTVNDSTSVVNSSETTSLIGDYYGTGTLGFDGRISNTQIFNTALPATGSNSVETLYNNGSPLTSMSGFTSLQGSWKLDASATYDGTDWSIPDDSSNSNDGTSSGMTQANLVQSDLSFTSGYSPYALDFDGVNDYIDLTSDITLSDNKSVSFWVNFTSTIYGVVFGGASNNYYPFIDSTNISIRAGGTVSSFAHGGITAGVWYHICITGDGTNATAYLNGSSLGTQTDRGFTFKLINGEHTGLYGVDGKLSNCAIWNTVLTSAQVTEIYSEGLPQNINNHSAYSNLVSWWQLGSNSSFNTNWTVLDEKGSNNGTSVNMTEVDIVDGVGSYANGLSSGMGGDEVIGDAPYSSSNSLSVNMDVEDRTTDTPS